MLETRNVIRPNQSPRQLARNVLVDWYQNTWRPGSSTGFSRHIIDSKGPKRLGPVGDMLFLVSVTFKQCDVVVAGVVVVVVVVAVAAVVVVVVAVIVAVGIELWCINNKLSLWFVVLHVGWDYSMKPPLWTNLCMFSEQSCHLISMESIPLNSSVLRNKSDNVGSTFLIIGGVPRELCNKSSL